MSSATMSGTRRNFIASSAVLTLAACKRAAKTETSAPGGNTASASIARRKLGSTGVEVSMIGIGGYHIGIPESDDEGIRMIRSAIDRGINFLDNCWDYHGGKSEERMGRALRDGFRDKAFLMTKIDGRTRASAAAQIDQCLKRLQTDRIDLMQIHEVIRSDDPNRVFAVDGAMEALVDAKKAGKIRFIGFTGHKDPSMFKAMLDKDYPFDTLQMPLNVMDAHFRSFEREILPIALKRNMGILGMKPLASGEILKSGAASAEECLRYALSLPTSVVITGCQSMKDIDQAVNVAANFKPLAAAERDALLARTAPAAAKGEVELYKTSDKFDGTEHHKHWLDTDKI
jgi:predicted aldo/keto reductase-like oxidoreductase